MWEPPYRAVCEHYTPAQPLNRTLSTGRHTGWAAYGWRGAGISMNYAQEREPLAQADRHIIDLLANIVRQRVLVKHVRDTGQPSDLAESP
jgi:hypothetical protein